MYLFFICVFSFLDSSVNGEEAIKRKVFKQFISVKNLKILKINQPKEVLEDEINNILKSIVCLKNVEEFRNCIIFNLYKVKTYYCLDEMAILKILKFNFEEKKIYHSHYNKLKVTELYIYIERDFFNENILKLFELPGFLAFKFVYEAEDVIYGKSCNFLYTCIYYDTNKLNVLLNWLIDMEFLQKNLSKKKLTFIYISEKQTFDGVLSIYNSLNFSFIKQTNKYTNIPMTQEEHLIYAINILNILICKLYKKDLNRGGLQNSGVGPLSLIVFEGAYKAIQRALEEEYNSIWSTDNPTIGVVLNTPMYIGSNSGIFAFTNKYISG